MSGSQEVLIAGSSVVGSGAVVLGAISAEGWGIIIGAVFLGLGQLATIWLNHLRASATEAKLANVETNVTTKVADVETKIVTIDAKVEGVHVLANSMKDAIVAATERAAKSEGEAAGRAAQKEENKQDVIAAKEVKVEEKAIAKQDAQELKEQTVAITSKLESVKSTGEDTNKEVKKPR